MRKLQLKSRLSLIDGLQRYFFFCRFAIAQDDQVSTADAYADQLEWLQRFHDDLAEIATERVIFTDVSINFRTDQIREVLPVRNRMKRSLFDHHAIQRIEIVRQCTDWAHWYNQSGASMIRKPFSAHIF